MRGESFLDQTIPNLNESLVSAHRTVAERYKIVGPVAYFAASSASGVVG